VVALINTGDEPLALEIEGAAVRDLPAPFGYTRHTFPRTAMSPSGMVGVEERVIETPATIIWPPHGTWDVPAPVRACPVVEAAVAKGNLREVAEKQVVAAPPVPEVDPAPESSAAAVSGAAAEPAPEPTASPDTEDRRSRRRRET